MALDVMLLANQVRDMTKLVVDGAAERRRRRQIVQQTLTKHVGHEPHWNEAILLSERTAWLQAMACEPFDTQRDVPPVLATRCRAPWYGRLLPDQHRSRLFALWQ